MHCFLKKIMQTGNYFCRRWQFWQISPCQRTLQGDKSWHRIPAAWLRGPRDRQGQEKVWRVHWVAACSWQGTWSLATPAPPLSLPYHLHGGQGLSPGGDPPMGCGKWHMQPGTNYQVLNQNILSLWNVLALRTSQIIKFKLLVFSYSSVPVWMINSLVKMENVSVLRRDVTTLRYLCHTSEEYHITDFRSVIPFFYFPQDCDDSSDEKNCRTISFDEEKYLKNKPPPPPEGSSYLPITAR